MRHSFFLSVLILALSPNAEASKRISSCTIEVYGETWLKGPCEYESTGPDGSFMVADPKMVIACDVNNDNKPDESDDCANVQRAMFTKGAFAFVSITSKGVAEGWWNEGYSIRGQSHLGELKRNGACWSNENATICAVK